MNNVEMYNQIFSKVFGVMVCDLGENFSADKVEKWDSINQMSLISEIEDQFGIMMEIEDIIELTSYEKGKEILQKYGIKV